MTGPPRRMGQSPGGPVYSVNLRQVPSSVNLRHVPSAADTDTSTSASTADTSSTMTSVKTPKGVPAAPRGTGKPKPRGSAIPPLLKTARTLTNLIYRPQFQAMNRAGTQATQQYQTGAARSNDIYNALGQQLQQLIGPYQQGMAGVTSGLQSQIAGLPSVLQEPIGAAPSAEVNAGNALVGTTAAGALSQLAGDQARNLAYNTSAQQQGITQNAVTQQNALTDLQNFQNNLAQQRLDLASNMPAATAQQLQQLQQQAFSNRLALGQLAVSRGNLGVSQGNLGLSQQAQNYTMAQQAAVMAAWQKILNDPAALAVAMGSGGLFSGTGGMP